MSTDVTNDRITIKNLIFTKALPNHTIPVPTEGYKIFPCIDCGDKFLFETSYIYHTNRKSLKIVYFCRYCSNIRVFYNRCKFLSHIRSHAFTTATINVNDLKLEPLPIEDFNMSIVTANNDQISETQTNQEPNYCYECQEITNKHGVSYKDRAEHYMYSTMKTVSCPICWFLLPTTCALEAHLRIHLKVPPYFCPECGILLPSRSISYPYNHDCKGFKMMKAAVRVKCSYNNCKKIFHPNEYKTHFRTHFETIYKCSFCLETSTKKPEVKCKRCNDTNGNIINYLRCPICPNKLLFKRNVERHLNSHFNDMAQVLNIQIYPCNSCNTIFENMHTLLNHYIRAHKVSALENLLSKVSGKAISNKTEKRHNSVYHRVIKRCNKCLRSFKYRCTYENIETLPNECPYKCSMNQPSETNEKMYLLCPLCKRNISENWSNIMKHFAMFHKSHKCLDLKVMITKYDSTAGLKLKNKGHCIGMKKKPKDFKVNTKNIPLKGDNFQEKKEGSKVLNICNICKCNCENKKQLENHMTLHRDPCMAYQCLECGQCFVVKPSFSTHLLLEHEISDVQEYINEKPCYNEFALLKNQTPLNIPIDEPIQENQCRICREQFKNNKDLEKHFRVHGMAFLLKNTLTNNSP